jgi:hypothetical protein
MAGATLPLALLYGWFNASLTTDGHLLFRLIAVLVYTGCLCLLVGITATAAKVRHPKWMGWLGGIAGLIGWYAQWVSYVSFSLPHGAGSMVQLASQMAVQPLLVLDVVQGAQAEMIASHPVFGTVRLLSWIAELTLMVLAPSICGAARAADPYCERSNAWADSVPLPHLFACSETPATAVKRLEEKPDDIFSMLTGSLDDTLPYHWKVNLYHCRAGDIYVTVRRVKNKKVKGIDLRDTPPFLVENLRLSEEKIEEVERKFGEAAERIPTPPELLEAVAALEHEQYLTALNVAAPHVESDRYCLRVDALRMAGIANSKLERWSEARQTYIALFKDEPAARNALQVATSSVMAGEIECGEEWVAKAMEMNQADRTVHGLGILTNFMTALIQTGHMKLALPYLEEVKKCYESLNITDSTFLWMRGVPFFGSFLEKSAVIIRATLEPAQARAWYESMLPHVDQPGKDMLNELLRAWPEQAIDSESPK